MEEEKEITSVPREPDVRMIRRNLILTMIFDTLLASTILLTYLYSVVGLSAEQVTAAMVGFLWIAPLTMGVYSFVVYLFFRPVIGFLKRYHSHEATDRITIINAQARVSRGPLAVSLAGLLFWMVGAILMAVWLLKGGGISTQQGWMLVVGGIIAAFGTNSHSLYRLRRLIRPYARLLLLQSQASRTMFKEATSSIKTRFLINLLSMIVFALFFTYLTTFSETLSIMKNQTRLHLQGKVIEMKAMVRRLMDKGAIEQINPAIDETRIGKSGYGFLVDTSQGKISTSHINAALYMAVKDRIITTKTIEFFDYGRENLLIAFGPVPNSHYFVGGVIDLNDFRPDVRKFAVTSALVILICLVLSLAMANASGQDIVEPISELIEEASLITEGQLDHPIYSEGSDEISVLATAFEKMRLSLKRQMEEKSKKVTELMTLYELGQQLEKMKTRDTKLNALLTSIVYKLNYERAVLLLLDDSARFLQGTECRGNNPNNLDPKNISISMDQDNEILVQALKTGSSILVEDALNDGRVSPTMNQLFQNQSFIAIPLRQVSGPLGIVVIDNTMTARPFSQEDFRILSIITNQVIASL
jgi:HAMP domain-containing protein